ncbi:hypothetical protein [Streptomyces xylophagus]|uniref:hypothetical protein n=1 Tax=Streptomyces xylophagus TaxID=285514 RepID=UPI000AD00217|nr:hypothetical protein [Streptomyces xylophagus]
MTEVDVLLLLAVHQPGVCPFALGELVHENVRSRERGTGLLSHDPAQQYALPAAVAKRDTP